MIDQKLIVELEKIAEPGALMAELYRRFSGRMAIGTSGQLVAVKIYQSSGNALLDNAALRAARASTFRPPSVQSDYLLEYVFQLE